MATKVSGVRRGKGAVRGGRGGGGGRGRGGAGRGEAWGRPRGWPLEGLRSFVAARAGEGAVGVLLREPWVCGRVWGFGRVPARTGSGPTQRGLYAVSGRLSRGLGVFW